MLRLRSVRRGLRGRWRGCKKLWICRRVLCRYEDRCLSAFLALLRYSIHCYHCPCSPVFREGFITEITMIFIRPLKLQQVHEHGTFAGSPADPRPHISAPRSPHSRLLTDDSTCTFPIQHTLALATVVPSSLVSAAPLTPAIPSSKPYRLVSLH
jgi:hypothetical protein